jgi:predicted transglutaminase-like cysteine proteinase
LPARLPTCVVALAVPACLALATLPASAQILAPPEAPADARDIGKSLAQPEPRSVPDLFGFGALRLGQTIYDDIWSEAAARPWPAHQPELDSFVARLQALPISERAQQANAWINARVRFGNDPKLIDPHWGSLAETLANGSGEREDIAIAKMQLLAAAGVPRDDLYVVLASDIRRLKPDALLVVRDGACVYVLDSRQDAFVDEHQIGLYVPIIALGYRGKWIFGHRAGQPDSAGLAANQADPSAAPAHPAALDVGQAVYQSLLPAAR